MNGYVRKKVRGIRGRYPFVFQSDFYWSGTEFDSEFAWRSFLNRGTQSNVFTKADKFYAWTVHDGDVPAVVPIPA